MIPSIYNYDSEQVRERIRQLMKEMNVQEYVEPENEKASPASETN